MTKYKSKRKILQNLKKNTYRPYNLPNAVNEFTIIIYQKFHEGIEQNEI